LVLLTAFGGAKILYKKKFFFDLMKLTFYRPLQGESFRVNPSPFHVENPARGGGEGEHGDPSGKGGEVKESLWFSFWCK
jgi:hypothetical protein